MSINLFKNIVPFSFEYMKRGWTEKHVQSHSLTFTKKLQVFLQTKSFLIHVIFTVLLKFLLRTTSTNIVLSLAKNYLPRCWQINTFEIGIALWSIRSVKMTAKFNFNYLVHFSFVVPKANPNYTASYKYKKLS